MSSYSSVISIGFATILNKSTCSSFQPTSASSFSLSLLLLIPAALHILSVISADVSPLVGVLVTPLVESCQVVKCCQTT